MPSLWPDNKSFGTTIDTKESEKLYSYCSASDPWVNP
jgi:hypothetical protein